jgi:hemolysin III
VALISLHGALRTTVLAVVWIGAAVATLAKMCWVRAPEMAIGHDRYRTRMGRRRRVATLARNEGLFPLLLLATGGVAYTAGALVYARRRPDPPPRVFGYHELFHALTIIALACQYVVVAVFIGGVS